MHDTASFHRYQCLDDINKYFHGVVNRKMLDVFVPILSQRLFCSWHYDNPMIRQFTSIKDWHDVRNAVKVFTKQEFSPGPGGFGYQFHNSRCSVVLVSNVNVCKPAFSQLFPDGPNFGFLG